MGGAAHRVRSTSAVNGAVAVCTFVVGFAVRHAVITGSAAGASARFTTQGPPA